MILAIDIGNSQTSLGLADGGSWRAEWRVQSNVQRTADEYGVLLARLFGAAGVPQEAVARVVLSTVVPELRHTVTEVSRQVFGCEPLVVGPGVRTGMTVRYRPEASLGSDRLADAVAAREDYGAPVVVVDFGTATTFNVVDAAGAFAGGAIAPGIAMAASALAASGARLQRIDLQPSEGVPPVGKNTRQGMQAGVIRGYAGLVRGLLRRFEQELGSVPTVVATGGLAPTVAPLVERIGHVEPRLTLRGLCLIAERNP